MKNQNDECVMYILVNSDIKMGKGKIASQACHSACHVTRILERLRTKDTDYTTWIKEGEPKIVLKSTYQDMMNLIDVYEVDVKVKRESTDCKWCVYTRDFGRTQIAPDTLTTVAFKPMKRRMAPKELNKMKLL